MAIAVPRSITAEAIISAIDKTAGAYKSAAKNIAKLESVYARAGKRIQNIGVGMTAAITVPLMFFAKSSLEAFAKQEKQMMKFDLSLQKNQKTVGVTRKQMDQLADSLVKVSGGAMDADDAYEAMSTALMATHVKNQQFISGMKLAADVSAKMGISVQDATDLIFKSLEHPERAFKRLEQLNINFTMNEKKRIVALVKAGKIEEAQRIIIGRGMRQYRGALAEWSKSTEARLKAVSVAWENLGEAVGEAELPFVVPLTEHIRKLVNWFNALPKPTKEAIVQIGLLAAALGPLLIVTGSLVENFTRLAPLFSSLAVVIASLGIGAYVMWKNWDKLNPELQKGVTNLGLMWTAIKEWDWTKFTEGWTGFTTAFANFDETFTKGVQNFFGLTETGKLGNLFTDAGDIAAKAFLAAFDKPPEHFKFIDALINYDWAGLGKRAGDLFHGAFGGKEGTEPLPYETTPGATVPGIPQMQHGGRSRGGWAMVGEAGPELVRLPVGAQVHSAAQSRAMMASVKTSESLDDISHSLDELLGLWRKWLLDQAGLGGSGGTGGGGGGGAGAGPGAGPGSEEAGSGGRPRSVGGAGVYTPAGTSTAMNGGGTGGTFGGKGLSANAKSWMSFFMGDMGYDKETAAAFTAGLMGESGRELNPKSYNPNDPGGAYGTAQWTQERKRGLFAFAKARGKPWWDVPTQQQYWKQEATGKYAGAVKYARQGRTSGERLRRYVEKFEGPRFNNWVQRSKNLPSLLGGTFEPTPSATSPAKQSTADVPIPREKPAREMAASGVSQLSPEVEAALKRINRMTARRITSRLLSGNVISGRPFARKIPKELLQRGLDLEGPSTGEGEALPWKFQHPSNRLGWPLPKFDEQYWKKEEAAGRKRPPSEEQQMLGRRFRQTYGFWRRHDPSGEASARPAWRTLGSSSGSGGLPSSIARNQYDLQRGRVDVNLKLDPGLLSERIKVEQPERLTVNTGIDRTGTRLHRPGGTIGPVALAFLSILPLLKICAVGFV